MLPGMRVFAMLLLLAGSTFVRAQSCGPVPTTINGDGAPVVAGTNELQIGNNGTVTNGTSTVPAVGNGTSVSTSSGVQPPGQSLPGFLPSTFPTVGTTDATVDNGTLAAGLYDDITLRNTSTFSGGTYYMQTISANNGVTLNIAAGDYFVENFSAGNNFHLNVTSGPVRIFVKNSFQTGNDPIFNAGGSPADLQIYLYDNASLQFGNSDNSNTSANFSGLIYAPGGNTSISMGNNNTVQGAVLSGGSVSLGNNTGLIFDPATQDAIGSIDTCGLIGDWRMDEISAWNGTAGEVKDSSGKGRHGTAVAGATTASASPAFTSGAQSTCGYGYFDRTGTLRTYVSLPSVPKMTQSFTVVAWIRSSSSTSQHQRIFSNDDNDNGWALSLADGTSTGIVRLFNRNVSFSGVSGGTISDGNVSLNTPNVITSNNWFFVAASVDTTRRTVTLYVYNTAGSQVAKTTASYVGSWCASSTCAGTSAIGGETSASSEGQQNSWHFLGNIDEVRLFLSALSQTDVQAARTRVRACPSAGPDHIRIFLNNDSSALTCSPRALSAIACADSACNTRYGNSVSVTLAPNGVSATIPANGTGTPTVSSTAVGSQNVTLSASSPAAGGSPNFRCYAGTVGAPGSEITGSCSLSFAASGLILSVPNHLSCKMQTLTISAVKTDDATRKCVPAFDSGASRDIAFRFSYADPDPGSVPATTAHVPRIGSVADGNPASGTALATGADRTLTLTFNGGNATTGFLYDDAGGIVLKASYAGSAATGDAGLTLTGSSSPAIIVAPASFSLAVPAAPLTAGTPFPVTVTARNACTSPATTTNFGKEASSNPVALSSTNAVPGNGNAAAIADAIVAGGGASPFAGSGAGAKDITWNEVGTVDIVATLSSYQGWALPTAATGLTTAGRFKPHHLETEVTPGCATAFTYSGQPFTVKTTAYRQGGTGTNGVTANYAGATWARDIAFTALSDSPLVPVPVGTGGLSNGAHQSTDFSAGSATRSNVSFAFANQKTAPLTITLRATESSGSDGVTSNGYVEGSTQQRSGRLWLGNAFGSEFLTLRLPMQTQFWSATGWQRNVADTCTQLIVPNSGNGGLVFGAQTTVNQLAAGETTASMAGTPAGRVVDGDPLFSLSAPGAGNFGHVDVDASKLGAPVWLPPTGNARACFGTCGPRRPVVIFQRGGY